MMVDDLVAVLEQRGLGDLDLQPVRGEAGFRQKLDDLLGERGVAELDRRDVDRDLEVRRPGARVLHRLLHDAHGQRADEAGRFGDLDEMLRLEETALGRTPASQRLETDQFAAIRGRSAAGRRARTRPSGFRRAYPLRASGARSARGRAPGRTRRTGCGRRAWRRRARRRSGAARPLRSRSLRDRGKADRGRDLDLGAGREHRRRRAARGSHWRPFRRALRRLAVEQDGEFVAADARAAGSLRRRLHQGLGDDREQLVAGEMAVEVVDPLEMVEVEQEQSAGRVWRRARRRATAAVRGGWRGRCRDRCWRCAAASRSAFRRPRAPPSNPSTGASRTG